MATYVIGDIHGRMDVLKRLLKKIDFSSDDTVWLVGDLVNVGLQSLEVLEWSKSLGDRVVITLGNHDLHMLAVAEGIRPLRKKDTFHDVLVADHKDELFAWLRTQKLVHREHGFLMVHAGLLPQWTPKQAETLAAKVERKLVKDPAGLFKTMYGNEPACWSEKLKGDDKRRIIINACTRARILEPDGTLEFDFKGEVEDVPKGFQPWYELFDAGDETLLFGHWSALDFRRGENFISLDSGCAWKRKLTGVRLDDLQEFQVPAT